MSSAPHNPPHGLKRRAFRRESGYMLLILMFFVALLTFSMMAVLPKLVQQIKRDREEEMIHRGTEYARAVKKFYKKFNRYPGSIKDLENTNTIRFIRRPYKDPVSKGGDWRLLHITDVQQQVSNPNFGISQATNFNPPQGASPNGALQINPNANPGDSPTPPPTDGSQPPPAPTTDPAQSGQTLQNPGLGPQPGQTFGGGGIVGVASVSKKKGIREFNNKSHYFEWLFIYDPTHDRGQLLRGPYNPQAFIGGSNIGTTPAGINNPGGTPQQQQNQPAPGNQMPPDQNAPPQ